MTTKDLPIEIRLAQGDIGEYDYARVVLSAALEKIRRPGAWLQGATAENAAGEDTYPWAEDACAWCATGAIQAVEPDMRNVRQAAYRLLFTRGGMPRSTLSAFMSSPIVAYNDAAGRTQAEVVRLFEQAIGKETMALDIGA